MQIKLNYRPNTFKQTQWVKNNTTSRVFEIAKNTASSFAKEDIWKHALIGSAPQDSQNDVWKHALIGSAPQDSQNDVWKHALIGNDSQDSQNDNNQLRITSKGVVNELILKCEDARIAFLNAKIDVHKKNYIISTRVVNLPGLVKEFIQVDDYNVTISGNLMFEKGCFPYEELKKLNEILSTNNSLNVANRFLEIFGIEKLVFKSSDFNQSDLKYMNVMPYKITFESDMDYDFLIQD